MSKPSQREQIQKGLQHLKGSDKIIGDIVAYCVQVYKADPSQKTIEKVRKYVEDTANSVSEHVLTIAHNLNRIVDQEAKEIEDLTYQTKYVSHRLKSHQRYMSELFMTKFQTFPRPRPTIHILRQAIPENQLPRYARRKRPWQRQTTFDYKILDQVGARRTGGTSDPNQAEPASPRYGPSGVASPSGSSQQMGGFNPPAAVAKPFNPYEAKSPDTSVQTNAAKSPPTASNAKGPTLFQRSQNNQFGFGSIQKFSAAPPAFGAAPVDPNSGNVGRGMSASVVRYVGDDEPKKPPNVNVNANANAPPAAAPNVPDIPPMANQAGPGGGGGPPPPPVPNFAASFAPPKPNAAPAADAAPAQGGGPPQPPVPPVPNNVGGPPQPPVPPIPPSGAGGPPPPVPNAANGGPPQPPPPPM